ncbi:hypothetical protein P8452_46684 [Trifolium repens]|nr:hypothetical protein P8452_46684 [Trifolium repens]
MCQYIPSLHMWLRVVARVRRWLAGSCQIRVVGRWCWMRNYYIFPIMRIVIGLPYLFHAVLIFISHGTLESPNPDYDKKRPSLEQKILLGMDGSRERNGSSPYQ